jgi:DNA replication protein DnaC
MGRHDKGRWIATAELLRKLRVGMDSKADGWADSDVEDLARAPILVVDDVASERLTDWGRGVVCDLIAARYDATGPMILTSNLSVAKLASALDDRTASRLADGGLILKIEGPDRRLEAGRTAPDPIVIPEHNRGRVYSGIAAPPGKYDGMSDRY